MAAAQPRFRFAIDRGGTFCDVYAEIIHEDGRVESRVEKLLSEDPRCVLESRGSPAAAQGGSSRARARCWPLPVAAAGLPMGVLRTWYAWVCRAAAQERVHSLPRCPLDCVPPPRTGTTQMLRARASAACSRR